eukprot:PhM_4_TR15497/c0_g1_i1/m.4998
MFRLRCASLTYVTSYNAVMRALSSTMSRRQPNPVPVPFEAFCEVVHQHVSPDVCTTDIIREVIEAVPGRAHLVDGQIRPSVFSSDSRVLRVEDATVMSHIHAAVRHDTRKKDATTTTSLLAVRRLLGSGDDTAATAAQFIDRVIAARAYFTGVRCVRQLAADPMMVCFVQWEAIERLVLRSAGQLADDDAIVSTIRSAPPELGGHKHFSPIWLEGVTPMEWVAQLVRRRAVFDDTRAGRIAQLLVRSCATPFGGEGSMLVVVDPALRVQPCRLRLRALGIQDSQVQAVIGGEAAAAALSVSTLPSAVAYFEAAINTHICTQMSDRERARLSDLLVMLPVTTEENNNNHNNNSVTVEDVFEHISYCIGVPQHNVRVWAITPQYVFQSRTEVNEANIEGIDVTHKVWRPTSPQ